MQKRIMTVAAVIIMALALLTACGKAPTGDDGTKTGQPATAQPTDAPANVPTDAPTAAPTEVPTEAPTEAPTEVPTEPAEATDKPDDGSIDLEKLIDDSFGSIEVGSSSITLDVLSTYGDVAYFTLDNSQDFTLSFRISEYLPTENHQQVGILIAPDVRNLGLYGKFMRTFSGENVIEYYGTANSWNSPEGAGRTKDPFTDSDSIYMKLTAADGKFTFSASKDGAEWTVLDTYDVLFTDDLQIGFTGATFTSATAHAVFDNIQITYN